MKEFCGQDLSLQHIRVQNCIITALIVRQVESTFWLTGYSVKHTAIPLSQVDHRLFVASRQSAEEYL